MNIRCIKKSRVGNSRMVGYNDKYWMVIMETDTNANKKRRYCSVCGKYVDVASFRRKDILTTQSNVGCFTETWICGECNTCHRDTYTHDINVGPIRRMVCDND